MVGGLGGSTDGAVRVLVGAVWLHAADTATRFQNVLLFVSCWIPAIVAIVCVDWWRRQRPGCDAIDPVAEPTSGGDGVAALATFVASYLLAAPFMNTSVYLRAIAEWWHGADVAYFVNFVAAFVLYGGWRTLRAGTRN